MDRGSEGKLFSNWSRWDTLGTILVLLILIPPLALVVAVCWGLKVAAEGIATGFRIVATEIKDEIGGFFRSLRKSFTDFWWAIKARWRGWRDRGADEPETVWTVYAEILRRYRENCRIINKSPMSREAKRSALENEERQLEERIGELLR